jgi:hypothetical protein
LDLPYLERLIPGLRAIGIEVAPGLTDEEIVHAENKYGFQFPPDLRMLLQYAMPISDGFVNWRADDEDAIRDMLEWPLEGMCFDIEVNSFWMASWGEKPKYLSYAFRVAKQALRKAPKLIPVCGHRYIPDEPHLSGNPMFSVYQTDIIYYGYDLADYFFNEFWHPDRRIDEEAEEQFKVPRPVWSAREPRPILFWSDVTFGYAGRFVSEETS